MKEKINELNGLFTKVKKVNNEIIKTTLKLNDLKSRIKKFFPLNIEIDNVDAWCSEANYVNEQIVLLKCSYQLMLQRREQLLKEVDLLEMWVDNIDKEYENFGDENFSLDQKEKLWKH